MPDVVVPLPLPLSAILILVREFLDHISNSVFYLSYLLSVVVISVSAVSPRSPAAAYSE
jgi:hypothetical protein